MSDNVARENHEDATARLTTHEAVCAERHGAINSRLRRIEGILIGSAGVIIIFLANIVAKLS